MKLRFYLRGLGIGMAVTAVILHFAVAVNSHAMSDDEIRARARQLGMKEEGVMLSGDSSAEDAAGAESPTTQEVLVAGAGEEGPAFEIEGAGDDDGTQNEGGGNAEGADHADGTVTQTPDEDGTGTGVGDGNAAQSADADGNGAESGDGNAAQSADADGNGAESGDGNAAQSADTDGNGAESGGGNAAQSADADGNGAESGDGNAAQTADNNGNGTENATSTVPQPDGQEDAGTQPGTGDGQHGLNSGTVNITIVRGDSSYTVAKRMAEAGIVPSAAEFDEFLCKNGYDRTLCIGVHAIPSGASYDTMGRILTGKQ